MVAVLTCVYRYPENDSFVENDDPNIFQLLNDIKVLKQLVLHY
jgi:hypothetical protein